jgi:hypothetical protein
LLVETVTNHSSVQIALDDSSGLLPLSKETHRHSPSEQTLHSSYIHHRHDVPDHAEKASPPLLNQHSGSAPNRRQPLVALPRAANQLSGSMAVKLLLAPSNCQYLAPLRLQQHCGVLDLFQTGVNPKCEKRPS